jgi:hypothetical protein
MQIFAMPSLNQTTRIKYGFLRCAAASTTLLRFQPPLQTPSSAPPRVARWCHNPPLVEVSNAIPLVPSPFSGTGTGTAAGAGGGSSLVGPERGGGKRRQPGDLRDRPSGGDPGG